SILQAGNPVKEILLKLNLPDHRSILTDSKIHIKMVLEPLPQSLSSPCAKLMIMALKEYGYQNRRGIQIQKVYEFKRFLDKHNDDDVIAVPHEDAEDTLGDTNDPFTSISMSKDFAEKDISANDAY
ncbi:hypothetical protein Tco_0009135, partial [Tanacetum coccineum]